MGIVKKKDSMKERFLKWLLSDKDKSRIIDKISLIYFSVLFISLLVIILFN
jgi:hypothetical protein